MALPKQTESVTHVQQV